MTRALELNKETNFLESINPAVNSFTADKKVSFLKLTHDCIDKGKYPSVHKLCKAIGIGVSTFHLHLLRDENFRSAWSEVKHQIDSLLTDNLAIKAESKMGTLATLALLKHLEAGKWNQDTTINHVVDNSQAKTMLMGVNDFIEADIIDDNKRLNDHSSAINGDKSA
jgi:hypothetical protein